MAHFHPDLARAARFIPRTLITPYTLPLLRGADRLITGSAARRADDVEVLTLTSGVGIRLHRPPGTAGSAPGMLWIHGGGYLIGTPAQDDAICRRFARALGITVAAVDYRLAPEHPYPVPLEDCYSALTWLVGLPAVDPRSVVIAGASAGGGLTAALALLARDRGEIDLAAQVLVYPMLDDRSSTAEGIDGSGHRLWTQTSNGYGWSSYLGDADPNVAVPSRREDLSGLPPAWLGVGTLDLFHDEDVVYAERLRTAGVPCQLEIVDGAFHGFDGIAPKAPVSRAFTKSQIDFLRQTLKQTEPVDA